MANLTIIGGGPAGLRAAEVAAKGGAKVTLYEGMPSVGRKFLVAGHGGLNLTHSDTKERFASRYQGSFIEGYWTSLLGDFSNDALRDWSHSLGIETFIGTSGRVFPKEFKAAPLLRSWVRHLKTLGVTIKTRHRLMEISPQDDHFHLLFQTPEGQIQESSRMVILALGGASWPQTGSNASWTSGLQSLGIKIAPFLPANCGWKVNWDDYFSNKDILPKIEGLPLKNIAVTAGEQTIQGELLITKYGLEGGALYQLGNTLRSMKNPALQIDLKPSFNAKELASKITHFQKDFIALASKSWRLSPSASALLGAQAGELATQDPLTLATLTKNLSIPLTGPRPIEEAISSAGGVSFEGLDENLMVKRLPGLFLAGEMLDWEAPTGGYLLQGCFATGTRAARGALDYLK
ncbi:MAG: TIGR03862 family flavoprotein [Chthoniobacterales bacterium]